MSKTASQGERREWPPLDELREVLTSLGYEIVNSRSEPICTVTVNHKASPKGVVMLFPDGAVVNAYWPLAKPEDGEEADEQGLFSFINDLNANLRLAACCLDETGRPQGLLTLRTLYPLPFEKATFTTFMQAWLQDMETFLRT